MASAFVPAAHDAPGTLPYIARSTMIGTPFVTVRTAETSLAALVGIGAGDIDAAIVALEDGLVKREGDLLFLGVHPLLDPLRADPRFADLRRRAGL